MTKIHDFDVLVIGSGAAGLSLALRLPESLSIAIISKRDIDEGNTRYAQGGISAVLDSDDSMESHIEDTLNAGAGLCDPDTVAEVVRHGPENIRWLLEEGVDFTPNPDPHATTPHHLTREGGHSHRRVIHSADATGLELQTTLQDRARSRKNIHIFENHNAVDLITSRTLKKKSPMCHGAYILDKSREQVEVFRAPTTVLATGGAGKVYLYTSNPDVATGDGIAIAWRAGCRVANMEFVQFHPTCLYHPEAKSFLLTEAIRGEGGKLLLPDGTRFMSAYDDRAELAPRDIVARAIDHEMKRLGADHLLLDISHKPADFIKEHFPTIHSTALRYGYDMTREPLPVVPAAHYTCGGIMTDLNARTDIPGLYAVGEVAFTGLHGANRMASNSLLECLVFAELAANDIIKSKPGSRKRLSLPGWDESRVSDSDEEVVVSHNWDELRRFMWDYVGIVRSNKRLERAKRRVDLLKLEIDEYYGNFRITSDLLELRNLVEVADLIIQSAIKRRESRGLHYTLDYPKPNNRWYRKHTVLEPKD